MAELVNVCSFILCEKSQCCENWLIRCFLGFSCLNLRLFDLVIFNLVVILKHIHPLVCLHCHGSVHSQRVITAQPDFTLYRFFWWLDSSNFVYAKFLQQFSLLILLQFYFATKSLTDFVADGICNNFPYWFCCIFKVQQNPLLILLHFQSATKSLTDFVAFWKCNKISKRYYCTLDATKSVRDFVAR